MKTGLVAVGAVAVMLTWAPAAGAFGCGTRLDSFNRADAATLGPSWQPRFPGIGIESLGATNPVATKALSTYRNRKAVQVCADIVTGGAATQYVALVLGYANLFPQNLFVKIQDNDADGAFDHAYFYRGNNGDDLVTEPIKTLAPFMSARLQVLWSGHTLRLDIDRNSDNRVDQSISVRGFPTAGLGTGIGLGAYGHAFADNFSIELPQTRITSSRIRSAKRKATFRFNANLPGSAFQCRIDGAAYRKCASPRTYRNLDRGRHTFRVRARDQVGNLDPKPAKLRFTI